jgi:hypothetical protein
MGTMSRTPVVERTAAPLQVMACGRIERMSSSTCCSCGLHLRYSDGLCRKLADYDLYCAMNSHRGNVVVKLPPPPPGQFWCRLADTNLASPRDWVVGGNKGVENVYTITGKSSILLMSKKGENLNEA